MKTAKPQCPGCMRTPHQVLTRILRAEDTDEQIAYLNQWRDEIAFIERAAVWKEAAEELKRNVGRASLRPVFIFAYTTAERCAARAKEGFE